MTAAAPPSHLARHDGLRLAYRLRAGAGPTLVFLPGYASDMQGSKALALDDWARRQGRALLRLDYSGNGESDGAFADGTLDRWRDDALLLIDQLTTGPLVIIGSSMGGWIALLVALARPARVHALVGIAAAPDFTEWDFDEARRAILLRDGRIGEPSLYSDAPLHTYRGFWESGQRHLLLDDTIAIDCPVRLLHGRQDEDVPWVIAIRTADALRSADVHAILVKDGDHRLSREQDLALLIATIEALPPPEPA
ncbi:MAG: alpha/beta hydrolase [Sphingomonadaceae bacterium]|nr:alpha/beta hydrolase [Sphingomonadaceae bacterium]